MKKSFSVLLIALLAGTVGTQFSWSQQQKKPTPTPTPKPVTQTANQQKPQPVLIAPKPSTQVFVTPQKAQPTAQSSATKAPTPIQPTVPTSHPQSTIAVSPSIPQALPSPISPTNNGLPANIPKTTIGPVSSSAQQSALLDQLKQALRVQQFHQDKLYYTIVCGPGTVCRQPSFTPNQGIPSPNDGLVGEQYAYLIQVENRIDQQARQTISQQGTAGAQNKINEIRRRYDPTYH